MNSLVFVKGAADLPAAHAARLTAMGFTGARDAVKRVTDEDGNITVFVGLGEDGDAGEGLDFWTGAIACEKAGKLPSVWVENPKALSETDAENFATAWLLASYRYGVFRASAPVAQLEGLPLNPRALAIATGTGLARDLINTPANHMRPGDLAREARDLAQAHGAEIEVIVGAELEAGFPLIHGVGAAAGTGPMAPRLIDMHWGKTGPSLTLVGKGITFDTGGLDLKPAHAMRHMKKDMGGAAHVLGLAHMIMALNLPVRLRVLVPTAENAVGAEAFRPGDVLISRAGLSVEIDNTDAEGRLVLADALTYANEGGPADLTVSMATLTGAARVALGPSIAPYLCNDEALMWDLLSASDAKIDPLWPLPLFGPYDSYLTSDIANVVNAGGGGFAGAITAALFLKRFVTAGPWAHFDVYGWNAAAKPGRPKGGAAQGLQSLLTYIENWTQND